MHEGELAQLAERVLSMHEVAGSIPAFSTVYKLFCFRERSSADYLA